MGDLIERDCCKMGDADAAVCSHQNWCENALAVLWEDSVAAEGVLGVRWQWKWWGGDTTPVAAAKK